MTLTYDEVGVHSTGSESIRTTIHRGESTRTIADLVQEVGHLRNQTRVLVADSNHVHETTTELHSSALDQLLRTVASQWSKKSLAKVLDELSSLGLSWRDVARSVGVSIPALRKWRQGESASGENRLRLDRLAAFCQIAEEHYHLDDVASWLEIPIHAGAPVTALDLLANGRFDLALALACDLSSDPESVLNSYDPEWRDRYASDVETFVAEDGIPGLRLRE